MERAHLKSIIKEITCKIKRGKIFEQVIYRSRNLNKHKTWKDVPSFENLGTAN